VADHETEGRHEASTLRGYQWLVETHIRPSLGRMKLAKITPTEIWRLLEAKADSGLSTATVRHIHGLIRNALADAEREELDPRNAAKLVRPPALDRPERSALTMDEARVLLASPGAARSSSWPAPARQASRSHDESARSSR